MAYKLTRFDSIIRLSDNACIPQDERNTDYKEYLRWLEAGNTPQPADPEPVPVQIVTMRQARLALHDAGKLAAIDAAVAQIGGSAQIEWEYATEVRRDWPLVAQVAAGVGMSSEQLDALFEQASKL